MYEFAKRKVDELGRIVLPIEVRKALNLNPKDELSIYVGDGEILLKKTHHPVLCAKEQTI